MNFLKNIGGTEGNTQSSGNTVATEAGGQNTMTDTAGKGGQSGGIMGGVNSMLGGGAAGEKNEDGLDKGIDFVQQHAMGGGPQDNESAAEQAKDEMMSDAIRGQYKNATGSAFPIQDK
ncbi:hypothetical protein BD410DRAFT_840072 [Rickenella mellea]|uniref:DNA damage-responsive protein 48 n=1 Tax=Rickenella mellea TaxID=50990 RepID=A0A4Y7Q2R1_9AGAM|nr:hypothetical protein BD410DRAFT_840072 [Rickenella mellea]